MLVRWFFSLFLGLATISVCIAAVPSSPITDDTALHQRVSEIKVSPQKEITFDKDIAKLALIEKRYKEDLPLGKKTARLSVPMKRISKIKYRPSKSRRVKR